MNCLIALDASLPHAATDFERILSSINCVETKISSSLKQLLVYKRVSKIVLILNL